MPNIVIEAQSLDSQNKPTRGYPSHIFGQVDGRYWTGEAEPTLDGKVAVHVPLGLINVQFYQAQDEKHMSKYRLSHDGPLKPDWILIPGTLDHDLKGIEIVRLEAPTLIVKAETKDHKPVNGARVSADYPDVGPIPHLGGRVFRLAGEVHLDVDFKMHGDGVFTSSQLDPEREAIVTAQADGDKPSTTKIKLPEGKREVVVLTLEPK